MSAFFLFFRSGLFLSFVSYPRQYIYFSLLYAASTESKHEGSQCGQQGAWRLMEQRDRWMLLVRIPREATVSHMAPAKSLQEIIQPY